MFRRKKEKEEPTPEEQLAEEVQLSTEEIEAEKLRKKQEREERKFLKEQQRISQRRQRFVAPILLLITIFISLLIWKFSK